MGNTMKRVLYWMGLLMIAGLVLVPDIMISPLALMISPLASDSQVLAQGSGGQTPSVEKQYSVPPESLPESLPSGCRLAFVANDGSKYYNCSGEPKDCYLVTDPNGVVIGGVCAAIAEPKNPRKSSQAPSQEIPQQPAQRCQILRTDPDRTEVSACGDRTVYKYPDGSLAMVSPTEKQQDGGQQGAGQQPAQRCQILRTDPDRTEVSACGDRTVYKYPDGSLAMVSPTEKQQDGGQQDGGQQDGGQQDGDQRSDGQQQDGGQQQASSWWRNWWQGFGCAARK
jgi:hypothetical protein